MPLERTYGTCISHTFPEILRYKRRIWSGHNYYAIRRIDFTAPKEWILGMYYETVTLLWLFCVIEILDF